MLLICPVCHAKKRTFDTMLDHLITEHGISKRQAKFLAKKLVEWKQGYLEPTLFPAADDSAEKR